MREQFYWLNSESRTFLSRGYLPAGKKAEDRYREIANNAESILGIKGFADKFYDYLGKGYYSLSTPVINNFGNKRGLPVSCFGSYIPDTMEGILDKAGEVGTQSKIGGGTSAYFGDLRSRGTPISAGGESSGPVHFMELFDKVADIVSQGCYDDQTEVLTNQGWKLFKEVKEIGLKNIRIAQVNDDETVSFVEASNYFEYEVNESLIWFKDSKNIDLLVTKNHNMVYKQEARSVIRGEDGQNSYSRSVKDKFYIKNAEECPLHRDIKYLHSAYAKNDSSGLSNLERILIAVQADGSIVNGCNRAIKFRFSKNRKSDRLKMLLDSEGIEYSYSFYESDQTHNYYVNFGEVLPKTLEWVNVENKSYKWCQEFILEVLEWDGSKTSDCDGNYSSVIKINVDKVQEVCSLAGYKSYSWLDLRDEDLNRSPIYKLNFSNGNYFGVEKLEKQEVSYSGKVFCVEVPSHKLIVRRGGRTVVCGNSARRGSFAAYLPVEHPDIEEFLKIRSDGHSIQTMSIGVTITNNWMRSMIDGDTAKRKIWAKIIEKRYETGYPYISFVDNINSQNPQVYRDKGFTVKASNLCNEITLISSEAYSFVCVLSSLNLVHWDEIKSCDAIETLIYFLDSVNEEFVRKTYGRKFLESSHAFARDHRALGCGVLGWHSLLQSRGIPFESFEAKLLNTSIAKTIRERSDKASEELAKLFGEAPVLKGYGRRNTHTLAIAPTTSSSFILGQVSPSIEPLDSNYFVKNLAKGSFTYKNPYLKDVLARYSKDDEETWRSILLKGGSVQHLDFLSQREKDTFKTFGEISQKEVVIQASARQKFIDQSQSLNIMVPLNTPAKEVSQLLIFGWEQGIKGFYYQLGANPSQELSRNLLSCKSCEA